jgi:membrane-associated phospholipid phosphatase
MLQMMAYLASYEMPNDDPEELERRAHVDYPVTIDRAIGLGELPGVRLQRALADPGREFRFPEKVLVMAHWVWFFVPHATVAWTALRRPERFPRAAALTYATFDLGALCYWLLPTAPPWYAAEKGRIGGEGNEETSALRRMMLDYGKQFWGNRWGTLYDGLAGNPLAAMPSLHFATSVMSARLLSELGPVEGAVGWAYAGTLGFALVYLGEHYVIDLIAGYGLAEGVRRGAPRVAPLATAFSRALQGLERRAQA